MNHQQSSARVERQTTSSSVTRDRVLVTAAAVVWIVGTLLGTGVLGDGGVQNQSEGLFSDSATLIAPAGPAFSIWSVIYLGLLGYVIWQWLPSTDRSTWAASTRQPAAAAILLNGVWLLVVFAGWVFVSVLVMAAIVGSLGVMLTRTAELRNPGLAENIFVLATFGLYLGWICVATCANIASWLVGLGVPADSDGSVIATIIVLVVVVALAAFLVQRTPHRSFQLAFTAAIVWGVGWVAAGRQTTDLTSRPIVIAATIAAIAVAIIGVSAALRENRRAALSG